MTGPERSTFLKYYCALPVALILTIAVIWGAVSVVQDFTRYKKDENFRKQYNIQNEIGEKLAIELREQELKKQGYACFTMNGWKRIAKK